MQRAKSGDARDQLGAVILDGGRLGLADCRFDHGQKVADSVVRLINHKSEGISTELGVDLNFQIRVVG
jgi:hypothetical protein